MTVPFIIWTTPRCGGTTLYEALWQASPDLRYVADEPFAPGNVWSTTRSSEQLKKLLGGVGYAIKHVLDPFSDEFNIRLAKVSTKLGYVHIHLIRRNELAWLISRGVALQLDTWNPKYSVPLLNEVVQGARKLNPLNISALIDYRNKVHKQWKAVAPYLDKKFLVTYEYLYGRHQPHIVGSLVNFLGIRGDISNRLSTGSQDTSRVWHLIPNADELRQALSEVPT